MNQINFFPLVNSFLSIILAVIIQISIYSTSENLSNLDLYLIELTVPLFLIGLLTVTLREDLSLEYRDYKKPVFPKKFLGLIFLFCFLNFFLTATQLWKLESSIKSTIFFIFSVLNLIYSSHLKRKSKSRLALLIVPINYLFILFILFAFYFLKFEMRLIDIYLVSSVLLFLTLFINLGRLETINNVIFVVPMVIEGYLVNFFQESDFSHLSLIHRICGILTGIGVAYIFFYMEKVKNNNFLTSLRFLYLTILGSLFIAFILFSLKKYSLFENLISYMNLNFENIYDISIFVVPAYVFNLSTYAVIRHGGGVLFNFSEILLLNFIFLLYFSLSIIFFSNVILYSASFLFLWALIFNFYFFKNRYANN